MEIYNELVNRVQDGETFYVNFEERTLKVGKDYLIKNGEYDKENLGWKPVSLKDVLKTIERLYENYKFSLPSERSDNKRRKYFKALSIDDIPDMKLFGAERREVAQAKLEGYILCSILYGNLTWSADLGSWFWQSNTDSDLVILKKWIKK